MLKQELEAKLQNMEAELAKAKETIASLELDNRNAIAKAARVEKGKEEIRRVLRQIESAILAMAAIKYPEDDVTHKTRNDIWDPTVLKKIDPEWLLFLKHLYEIINP